MSVVESNETNIETPYACKDCNAVFKESTDFHEHVCSKSEKTQIRATTSGRCEKCGKDCNNLKRHLLSHVEDCDFACSECGKKFRSKTHLRCHYRNHIARYICPVCKKGFGVSQNLKTHMRIHSDEKPFKCDQCNKAFTQKRHLQDHKLNHSNLFEHPCDVCGKLCRTKRALKLHKLCHNKESAFNCPVCNSVFPDKQNLHRHMWIHPEYIKKRRVRKPRARSEEKPHSCDYCGARFRKFCLLKQHLTKHTGEKPFVCDICQKAFHTNTHLNSHMNSHSDERPYSCTLCDKSFKNLRNLTRHCLLHTGEQSKQCNICGKTLSNSDSLKNHYLTHSDERPFHCEVCGKSFKRVTPLQNHLVTHTGELTHCCKVCGKRFARKSTLENHFILHTGEKPYICLICSKGFSRKSSLKIHVSTVHAKEAEPKKLDNRAEHMIAGDMARHAVLAAHNFLTETDIMNRKRPTFLRMRVFKPNTNVKSEGCDSENNSLNANESAPNKSVDSNKDTQITDIFEVDGEMEVASNERLESVSCVTSGAKNKNDVLKQRLECVRECLDEVVKTDNGNVQSSEN